MQSDDEKVIERSNTSTWLFLMFVCMLFAVGVAFWVLPDEVFMEPASSISYRDIDPAEARFLGLLFMVASIILCIVSLMLLFGKKEMLVFTSSGIIDHCSSLSAGPIPWEDITGAETLMMRERQEVLRINLRDPQKYIQHQGFWKRYYGRRANKLHGSPIVIAPQFPQSLKATAPELLKLFQEYQQKYSNA